MKSVIHHDSSNVATCGQFIGRASIVVVEPLYFDIARARHNSLVRRAHSPDEEDVDLLLSPSSYRVDVTGTRRSNDPVCDCILIEPYMVDHGVLSMHALIAPPNFELKVLVDGAV